MTIDQDQFWFYCYFRSFWTRIVEVDGKHADHWDHHHGHDSRSAQIADLWHGTQTVSVWLPRLNGSGNEWVLVGNLKPIHFGTKSVKNLNIWSVDRTVELNGLFYIFPKFTKRFSDVLSSPWLWLELNVAPIKVDLEAMPTLYSNSIQL